MTSKHENDKPAFKTIKSKTNLGGGDPKDDNHINGRDLIE